MSAINPRCINLESIEVSPDNPNFESDESGVLYSSGRSTLMTYPSGRMSKSYEIKSPTTAISTRAFLNSFYIEEVIIPDTVTELSSGIFQNCINLRTVRMPQYTLFNGDLFFNCTSLESIDSTLVEEVSPNCMRYTGLKSLHLPNVVHISTYTFANCKSLKTVTFGPKLKTILKSAFSDSAVTEINLPDSVETVGNSAFFNTDLQIVTISSNIKEIGPTAFGKCLQLRQVIFAREEEPLKTESTVFSGCTNLEFIDVPQDYKISKFCSVNVRPVLIAGKCGPEVRYAYDSNTKTLTLFGSGITYTYSSVESEKKVPWSDKVGEINSVAVNNGVTLIGAYLLADLTEATEIRISSTVEYIAEYALKNCKSLETIDLPQSLRKISAFVLANCESLKVIQIPEIEEISDGAFCNCRGLSNFRIPA